MQITRTSQRNDNPLEFSVAGDILIINGEPFDFSAIPDGGYVESVPCDWIVGPVCRRSGEIEIVLIEPYGPPEDAKEASHVES